MERPLLVEGKWHCFFQRENHFYLRGWKNFCWRERTFITEKRNFLERDNHFCYGKTFCWRKRPFLTKKKLFLFEGWKNFCWRERTLVTKKKILEIEKNIFVWGRTFVEQKGHLYRQNHFCLRVVKDLLLMGKDHFLERENYFCSKSEDGPYVEGKDICDAI